MPAVLLGLALFALDEAVFGCHFRRNEDKIVICQWIESVLVTKRYDKYI